MNRKLILVKPTDSPFIKVDELALSKEYSVETVSLNQDRGRYAYLIGIVKLKWKVLVNTKGTPVLVWFADYHALPAVLFARILNRKSLIFIGGYDAVYYPEFNYGVFSNPLRKLCAVIALKLTNLIIANDEALIYSENLYYNPKGHPEGVKRLIPSLQTPTMVIRNAPIIHAPDLIPEKRSPQILCVGGTPRYEDIFNKGYDLLFALARQNEKQLIVMVGIEEKWLERLEQEFGISELKNLIILPPLPHEEVLDLMLSCDIYVQPSISEGMPNALMEAMFCGCKPVGSCVAGIPNLIGEWGVVFTQRSVESLQQAVEKVRKMNVDRGRISESISVRFSFEKRRGSLLAALKDLLKS